jgi:excisionase family DNA binding protein
MGKKQVENPNFDSFFDSNSKVNVNFWNRRKQYMNGLELLTVKQMVKILSVSESTLHKLVKQNQIPHLYIGKQLRFRADSILEFYKKRERKVEEGAVS